MSLRRAGSLILLATSFLVAQTQPPPPTNPTLFVVGDLPFASIQSIFDPTLLNLIEGPSKGQTTRTYLDSGKWNELLARIQPGDFVLIGFNPNTDVGVARLSTDPRAAATLTLKPEDGPNFDYMDPDTHKVDHVHSYTWYLRRFIADSIDYGASPLLCYPPVPPDPANRFPNNPYLAYPVWSVKAITGEQHIPYVNLTTQPIRDALESLKPDTPRPLPPEARALTLESLP